MINVTEAQMVWYVIGHHCVFGGMDRALNLAFCERK
jgi:hypothetical protein